MWTVVGLCEKCEEQEVYPNTGVSWDPDALWLEMKSPLLTGYIRAGVANELGILKR